MQLAESLTYTDAGRAKPETIGRIELCDGLSIGGCLVAHGRDSEIFGEGEMASAVCVVQSGEVRLQRILDDGRRQIVGFAYPGDVIGLELGDTYSLTAEAVSDCQLGLVRRSQLDRHLADHPDQYKALWRLAAGQTDRALHHLVVLGRKCALERVAGFLLEAGEQIGGPGPLRLPMARADMADYLGLTIETVSRTLALLDRSDLIDLPTCRTVEVKSPALLRAAAEGHLTSERMKARA